MTIYSGKGRLIHKEDLFIGRNAGAHIGHGKPWGREMDYPPSSFCDSFTKSTSEKCSSA